MLTAPLPHPQFRQCLPGEGGPAAIKSVNAGSMAAAQVWQFTPSTATAHPLLRQLTLPNATAHPLTRAARPPAQPQLVPGLVLVALGGRSAARLSVRLRALFVHNPYPVQ